jgi:HK97 family phage major capsid protein
MLDAENKEALEKEAMEAIKSFREINERVNVSEEGQKKLVEDLTAATKKYDEVMASQKEAVAIAEQEAKAAGERALELERQFSLMRDKGVDKVVDKKTDAKLMDALIRGKEYLDNFLDTEEGVVAYDSYMKACASITAENCGLPSMTQFTKAAQRISTKAADTPSMRTDINLQGGVLLTPEQAGTIMRKAVEITPIEQYARVVTIGGKSIQQPVHEQIPRAYFAGELESSTNVTPKYSMMEFSPVRQSITIPVSLEMLNQSDYDIVGEINMNATKAFASGLGYNVVKGDGVQKPEGFTVNASVGYDETGGALTADDILGLIDQLPAMYNPQFFFSRLTLGKIRLLQDGMGRYLWNPGGGIGGDVMPTIGGLPYVDTFIDMDTLSTVENTEPILLADMQEFYQITKNNNIFMIRDDYTKSSEAQVRFTLHRWITGNVRNPEAGRFIRITS